MQPQIHLIDETWIDAPVHTVSSAVSDPANWARWWPDLDLSVTRDRGVKGVQWAARSDRLAGSVELWLEPFKAGVILHHYLRLDPVDGVPLSRRAVARTTRALTRHAKWVFWELKDRLELTGPARR